MEHLVIRGRCLAVVGAATTALVLAGRLLGSGMSAPAGDPGGGITRVCAALLLLALAWGWVTMVAGAVEAWRAAPGRADCAPTHATGPRRLVLILCGVACSGALLTPVAQASTPQLSSAATSAPTSAPASTAPATVDVGAAVVHEPRQLAAGADIVVRRGDCLWSLAADQVQPGAGPMTVTARWRALYAANRGVIGDDPDLIRPGQRLRTPR